MYFGNFFLMPLLCAGIPFAMTKDNIPFLILQGCYVTHVGCASMGIED
jgi:hypothetical protein